MVRPSVAKFHFKLNQESMTMKLKGLITLGVVGAVGAYVYVAANSLQQEGIKYETDLNGMYVHNQIVLSNFKQAIYEKVQVANLKSAQMDKIIEDAIKGRYDGGKMQPGTTGSMFSSIREAYPDIGKHMDIYDKIVDSITGYREEFKNDQSAMVSELKSFDRWRQSGLIQPLIISYVLRMPNEALVAHIGSEDKTGKDALKQMWTIVTSEGTQKSFKTGVEEPTVIPGAKP